MYDTNRNGKIDKKEMEKIINSIYDLLGETNRKGDNDPKNRVAAIFNKLAYRDISYFFRQITCINYYKLLTYS